MIRDEPPMKPGLVEDQLEQVIACSGTMSTKTSCATAATLQRRRHTAINDEVSPGYVAGAVASQKYDEIRDLFWPGKSTSDHVQGSTIGNCLRFDAAGTRNGRGNPAFA